jgi:macrolide transport system ATP-binding/permease protein
VDLIRLRQLQLSYRLKGQAFTALKQVDLSVHRGEMLAILGPSGSGKSTLLYILGCLLKPTAGIYEFAGRDLTSYSSAQLAELRSRTIGFVFQQFHLLARANILDNVLLGAQYNRSDTRTPSELREQALQVIRDVGLESHWHHLPNQLSGGQQQRVAIARALINSPDLILADEPTGNLDSKSAGQILDLLQEIHREGRTVIIITHDANVAKRCDRVVTILDGVLDASTDEDVQTIALTPAPEAEVRPVVWSDYLRSAFGNLMRNKARSLLTMVGVMIGIAAVLSTVTLGDFTKSKILESYESLGVNKLVIRAWSRWNLQAKDLKGPAFDGLSNDGDIRPLRHLFSEITLLSPVVREFVRSVEFGGQSDDQVSVLGVGEEYFAITRRKIILGQPFTRYHINNHSPVCVIGFDVARRLFSTILPLGRVLQIAGNNEKAYSCLVLGVMASQTSNNEWFKPNEQILVPESYLSIMTSQWYSKAHEFDMQMRPGTSVEDLTTKIKQFFHLKYGRSADIHVDSDQILVAQMRRFLSLFTMLLAGVALISLAVGGVGITNMMLVSVTERFKEIGLRKALGARDQEIRMQFLVESLVLCIFAGLSGLILGVVGYHTILFLASKLFPKVQFEWVFNFPAIALSLLCIIAVGIASGIAPALRAERLEVVEALRSE